MHNFINILNVAELFTGKWLDSCEFHLKKRGGIPGRGPSSTKAWRQEGAHGRDFLMAELLRAGARALRTDSVGMRRDDQTRRGLLGPVQEFAAYL